MQGVGHSVIQLIAGAGLLEACSNVVLPLLVLRLPARSDTSQVTLACMTCVAGLASWRS
jgi:hypothetical protein